MADFMTVMREYDRMCNGMGCCNCPIASDNNGMGLSCNDLMRTFPEEAERIILRWASEHPIMTNRKKFEEVFGFDILERFSFSEHNKEWLNKEYKDGDSNDS